MTDVNAPLTRIQRFRMWWHRYPEKIKTVLAGVVDLASVSAIVVGVAWFSPGAAWVTAGVAGIVLSRHFFD